MGEGLDRGMREREELLVDEGCVAGASSDAGMSSAKGSAGSSMGGKNVLCRPMFSILAKYSTITERRPLRATPIRIQIVGIVNWSEFRSRCSTWLQSTVVGFRCITSTSRLARFTLGDPEPTNFPGAVDVP